MTGFSRWITSPSALATHRWSWSLVMISMLNSSVVNAITTSPVVPSTASSSIRHLAYVCSERSIDSLENASETSTTGETHASSAVVVAARSAGSSEAKSATESSLGSNEPRSPALPTRRVHGDTPSELAEIALDVGASDSSVVDQPDERQQCGRTHHGPIGLEALTRRCRLGRGEPIFWVGVLAGTERIDVSAGGTGVARPSVVLEPIVTLAWQSTASRLRCSESYCERASLICHEYVR